MWLDLGVGSQYSQCFHDGPTTPFAGPTEEGVAGFLAGAASAGGLLADGIGVGWLGGAGMPGGMTGSIGRITGGAPGGLFAVLSGRTSLSSS